MLTSLHTLNKGVALNMADYLALSFDGGIDRVIMKGVRISTVITFL